MKFLGVFIISAVLALTNASVSPYHSLDYGLSSAKLIQGPSSRSTIIGPDGSAISSLAPGGSILTEETPGFIARATPVASPVAYSAPVVPHSYPLISEAHNYARAAPVLSPAAYGAPGLARSYPLISEAHNYARVAPIVSPLSYSAPLLSHSYPLAHATQAFAHTSYEAPLLARTEPLLAHSAGYASGFVGRSGLDTIVAGPSGTISTSRALEGPGAWAQRVVPSTYSGYGNGLYW